MHLKRIPEEEKRTIREIIEHYEIEKELANRLKYAPKDERKHLYTTLYNELLERVPHHPALTRKKNKALQHKHILNQIWILKEYFSPEYIFTELGPGDCALSIELCKYFKKVYAIDVSKERITNNKLPVNFEFILSNGTSVEVASETVNIAYSNQLMEHVHPDDAYEQLLEIYNSLVPSGIYICITPHRFMGPSDISKYFDNVATGFHLKEYTYKELNSLFKSVGFRIIKSVIRVKGIKMKIPITYAIAIEFIVNPLPHALRRKISRSIGIRNILSIALIATK